MNSTTGTRIIGVFFVLSGLYGFIFSGIREIMMANAITAIVAVFLFGLTMHTGYLLLKEDVRGIKRAKIVAALQFFNFQVVGITYIFFTGASYAINIVQYNFSGSFQYISRCWFSIGYDMGYSFFSVNIIAILLFFYLNNLQKGKKKSESQEEIAKEFTQPRTQTNIDIKKGPSSGGGGRPR